MGKVIVALASVLFMVAWSGFIYYRGYTYGFTQAEIKHEAQQTALIIAHKKMEDNLELIANKLVNSQSEANKLLDARTMLILKNVKGTKLTSVPDCYPTEDFRKAWNEVSKLNNIYPPRP